MKKIGLLFPFLLAPLLINCGGKGPGPTPAVTYSVTTDFKKCSSTDAPTEIKEKESLTFHVQADDDYSLPNEITVTGCEYTFAQATGEVKISNPTGDVAITIEAVQTVFTYELGVTFNNCSTTDKIPETIKTNQIVEFTVTPKSRYALPDTITVTGCEHTFDKASGKVTLSEPTTNVTVTIDAVQVEFSISTPKFVDCKTDDTIPTTIRTGSTITFTVKLTDQVHRFTDSSPDIKGCKHSFDTSTGKVTIYEPTSDVTITITAYPITTYKVNFNLSDTYDIEDMPEYISTGESKTFTIAPHEGYYFDNASADASEITLSVWQHVKADHEKVKITISDPHPADKNYIDISIDIKENTVFSVITDFTNCSSSDAPTTIQILDDITFYIEADEHYDLPATVLIDGCSHKEEQTQDNRLEVRIYEPCKDVTISATSSLTKYTIVWQNEDGTEFQRRSFEYGSTPTYTGVLPIKPEYDPDTHYAYEFDGWTPDIKPVTGYQVYTAKYKKVNTNAGLRIELPPTGGEITLHLKWESTSPVTVYWDDRYPSTHDVGTTGASHNYGNASRYRTFGVKIISDGITSLGAYCTQHYPVGCPNIKAIYLGEKITSIPNEAFKDDSGLTSIEIKGNITSIGNSAFQGCSTLTSIELPSTVTSIGNSAFKDCNALTSFTIPSDVTTIGDNTFENCTSLTSIKIPEKVTSIGNAAFKGCTNLEKYEIDATSSLEHMGDSAFEGCSLLKNVFIPKKVNYIATSTFASCPAVETIVVDSTNEYFANTLNGTNCNAIIDKSDNSIIFGIKSSIIAEGITGIKDSAFAHSSIESVFIPKTVTSIKYNAFTDCRNLTMIKVDPQNTAYSSQDSNQNECNCIIDKKRNSLCIGCGNSSVPDNVSSIDGSAFNSCSSLKSITIPKNIKSIAGNAFYNCESLETVTFDSDSQCTSIGNDAFGRCSSLSSIIIPKSITYFGYDVFNFCTNLSSVVFESGISLNKIEVGVFENCDALQSIRIPASVRSIEEEALAWNPNLKAVDLTEFITADASAIPSSHEKAFYRCHDEIKYYVADETMRDLFIAKGGGWPTDPNAYVIGAPSI